MHLAAKTPGQKVFWFSTVGTAVASLGISRPAQQTLFSASPGLCQHPRGLCWL